MNEDDDDSGRLSFRRRFTGVKRRAEADPAVVIPRWKIRELLGQSAPSGVADREPELATTVERPLAWTQMCACFEQLATGIAATCLARIDTELLRYGILFVRGDEEMPPSAAFLEFIRRKFVVLQQDALRMIVAIGVCPLAFERDEETGEITPYVPRPGSFRIGTASVRGRQIFSFYWNTSTLDAACSTDEVAPRYEYTRELAGHPDAQRGYYLATNTRYGRSLGLHDDTVVVLHGFGYDPSLSGQLRSIMSSILYPYLTLASTMTAHALTAEAISANPPLVTVFNSKALEEKRGRFREEFFVGSGVADPAGAALTTAANASYQRNGAEIDGLRENMRAMAERVGTGIVSSQFGVDEASYSLGASNVVVRGGESGCGANGTPMPWQNEFEVASDRTLAAHQLPRARTDLVPLLTYSDERVCAAFGVPLSLFQSGSSVKAGVEVVNETLDSTIGRWKKLLSDVLTAGYDGAFLKGDIVESLTTRARARAATTSPRRSVRRPLLTEADLFEVSNEVGTVRATFRHTPSMPTEELVYMYARGIIEWRTFAENYARRNGLDFEQVCCDKDKFDEEARRVCGVPGYAEYAKLQQAPELEASKEATQVELADMAGKNAIAVAKARPKPTAPGGASKKK